MKKLTKFVTATSLAITILATSGSISAALAPYGAAAADKDKNLNLKDMLTYAIQDEYIAQAEYNAIMKKYGTIRPFSNIIKSEATHISMLTPLFRTYNLTVPKNDAASRVVLPSTLQKSYETGVEAEIKNIAMYDRFLKQKLPSDVRSVFERLKAASENHLNAFKRAAAK